MLVETKYILVYKNMPINEQGVPTRTGDFKLFNSLEEVYSHLGQSQGPEGAYRVDTKLICTNPE